MNKIFKVVWSKVRNSYVVVSETAKANGKSGVKTIATVAAAAILMSGGIMSAEAADFNDKDYTSDNGTNVVKTVQSGHAYGSAIYANEATTLTNCDFKGNSLTGKGSTTRGGAVYVNGDLDIVGGSFVDNSVTVTAGKAYGGAIAHQGGTLNITDTTFDNNSVSGVNGKNDYGAAIYATGSKITIEGSTFKNHTGTADGLIYLYGGATATLGDGNVFDNNGVASVKVQSGTTLTLEGTNTFSNNSNNSIVCGGTVVFAENSETYFDDNTANYDMGGAGDFVVEKDAYVESEQGILASGDFELNGTIALGDNSTITKLSGQNGTIELFGDVLGKEDAIMIGQDNSTNTTVTVKDVDFSQGTREVMATLAQDLKNAVGGDVDGLTFSGVAEKSALYGDVEFKDNKVITTMDTDTLVVADDVQAGGVSLKETAAALDTKADKTYVDAELAKKANAADVYTKTEVDTALKKKVDNNASNAHSIAIGVGANTDSAIYAVAVGEKATATNTGANAIGKQASATGTNAVAVGTNANASGSSANAIGENTKANINSNAIGKGADASGSTANAIGSGAVATGWKANALGAAATATAQSANAIGDGAIAGQTDATAIGTKASASAAQSIAIGKNASASHSSATAIGEKAAASGQASTAIGKEAAAGGMNAMAIGKGTKANAVNATAIGQVATAGRSSVAIGDNAFADNGNSGDCSAVAIGASTKATGTSSTAVGRLAQATTEGAVAYGASSVATGDRATAVGFQAQATNAYDVALGSYSTTEAAVDVASATVGGATYSFAGGDAYAAVSVGTDGRGGIYRQIQNVAAGQVTADSTDAVNGSQLYAAYQAIDTNANAIAGFGNRLSSLDGRLDKVGAGAAALAALHPLDYDAENKLSFSAGVGNYAGETAAAVGAFYRPNEDVMFSIGGTAGNGENMVNAGVSFAIGKGSSGVAKLSKAELVDKVQQMEEKYEAVEAENEDLRNELNKLKAMVMELATKK